MSAAERPVPAQLIDALNERNSEQLNKLINKDVLFSRIVKGMSTNQEEQQLNRQKYAGLTNENVVSNILISNISSSRAKARLMKQTVKNGQLFLLVRFDMGESGFEYLEFILENSDGHGLKVIDWFQLSRGQLASVSFGALNELFSRPSENLLENVLGIESVDAAIVSQLQELMDLYHQKDFAQAYQKFLQLPDRLRLSFEVLILGVGVANLSKDMDAYKQTLQQLAEHHGDKPEAAFLLIDYYFFQKEWDLVLGSIDSIESRVGTDAMMELLRAHTFMSQKNAEKGLTHAKKAIALEPDFEDAYFSLASAYVLSEQFDLAISIYNQLIEHFNYQFSHHDFSNDNEFKDFVQSSDYEQWANLIRY